MEIHCHIKILYSNVQFIQKYYREKLVYSPTKIFNKQK